MTRWRRFLDRTLMLGAVVMAALSLYILMLTIRANEVSNQISSKMPTFYVSQFASEAIKLHDAIDRYGDGEVALGEVTLRFDILWSRVFTENEEQLSRIVGSNGPGVPAEILEARQVLREIEPTVLSLRADDTAAIRSLEDRLRGLTAAAQQLALAAKNESARLQVEHLTTRRRLGYLTFGFITLMALFGALSMYLLWSDRREIRAMNRALEDRVRSRTAELEKANEQLEAEIAERRCRHAVLQEREARLEQAAQLSKLGHYTWNAVENRCEFCSDQHARAHGLTPEEFIAQVGKLDGPLRLIHPEDRAMASAKYRELRDGRPIDIAYRVVTPTGVRRLRENARPILDETGRVVRVVGSTLDVTDQYETEMKLFEAQRMDSIGKLTGGIAHDFNNLLAVILGNLELLQEISDENERREMIADAIRATLRGRDLTMNMLSFARRAPLDPTELDLNQVVAGMEGLLRRTLPENIALKIALGDGLRTVMADRSLTESALLNLALNARDAMPSGGEMKIATANLTLAADETQEIADDMVPGDYVLLAVTDTGTGIRPELLDSIFEPFFTTKSITDNSGLGLSMVHGFIRQTGGGIRVRSDPGTGATFELYFQSAGARTQPGKPPPAAGTPAIATPLRLLLIEDDPTVRKVIARQLQRERITVVTAGDGDEAERAFGNEGPFDLVVSDIVIPGELQGPALVARLRERDGTLPAVFLSGYPQDAIERDSGLRPDDVVLMKPVGHADLLAAIRDVVRD